MKSFFKKNFIFFFLTFFLFAAQSCSKQQQDSAVQLSLQQGEFLFDPSATVVENSSFKLNATLKTNIKVPEALTLFLTIKNKSSNKIIFDNSLISLKSNSGFETQGFSQAELPQEIPAHKTIHCSFSFLPVNNPSLFQQIGRRGDFFKQYTLALNFLTAESGKSLCEDTITFILSDDDYIAYKKSVGIENTLSLYSLTMSAEEFIKQETAYATAKKIYTYLDEEGNTQTSFIKSIGNEFYVDKLLFSIVPYTIANELYVSIKIINRMEEPVRFDSEKFLLKTNGRFFSAPYNFSNMKNNFIELNSSEPATTLIIGQNERAYFTMHCTLSQTPDKIEIQPAEGLSFWNGTPVSEIVFPFTQK